MLLTLGLVLVAAPPAGPPALALAALDAMPASPTVGQVTPGAGPSDGGAGDSGGARDATGSGGWEGIAAHGTAGSVAVDASAGPWDWPLPGRPPVLRRFDPPATPYGPGHRGVDLGGAPGDPVLAAGPGVVAFAGMLAGRGVVSVQHAGGLRTTYEPVAVAVRAGAAVSPGAVLGRLLAGHAGCPWPACLHWGLRRGDEYLDPLSLLRRGPVRLLPRYSDGPDG